MKVSDRFFSSTPLANLTTKVKQTKKVSDAVGADVQTFIDDNSYMSAYNDNPIFMGSGGTSSVSGGKIKIYSDILNNYDYIATNFVSSCRYISSYNKTSFFDSQSIMDDWAGVFFVHGWENFEDIKYNIVFNVYNSLTKSFTSCTYDELLELDSITNFVSHCKYTRRIKSTSGNYITTTQADGGIIIKNNFSISTLPKTDYSITITKNTGAKSWNGSSSNPIDYALPLLENEAIEIDYKNISDGFYIQSGVKYAVSNTSSSCKITFLLDIDDFIKMLADCNICILSGENTYVSYRDSNGKTNGTFLLYDDWKISNSSNNNSFENTSNINTTPGERKDKITSMIDFSYFNYSVGGFNRYYRVSKEILESLSTEIETSTTIPDGYNVFDNIISISQLVVDVSDYTTFTSKENIKIGKWVTTTQANKILSQKTMETICSYYISREFNDFRDFAPFTTYQLYLPCYGVVTLPDTIVNHNIVIKRNSDITQNDFQYIICIADENNNIDIIDKINIEIGTNIEFTAENNAIKNINVLQNQLGTLNSFISGVGSVATKNAFGIASSITSIANNVISTDVAKNQNYLSHHGQNKSMCGLHDCDSIFLIKQISDSVVNADYGHEVGYIYNSTDTLLNHRGFCVCANVDLNIPCLKSEMDIIKQLLETGFII